MNNEFYRNPIYGDDPEAWIAAYLPPMRHDLPEDVDGLLRVEQHFDVEALAVQINSMSISNLPGFEETTFGGQVIQSNPRHPNFLLDFINRTVYLLSNNRFFPEIQTIISSVEQYRLYSLLRCILELPHGAAKILGEYLITEAALQGKTGFVQFLLDTGVYPTIRTLPAAIESRSMEVLELIIDRVDVNSDEYSNPQDSPLFLAINIEDFAIFRYLVNAGANLHNADNGLNCLEWACRFGRKEFVEFILERGVHPDETPALCAAAFYGSEEIVRLLLDAGADVHRIDLQYDTAAKIAAREGHGAVMRLLLEYEADAHSGKLIKYAIISGDISTVEVLLHHGARYGSIEHAVRAALKRQHSHILPCILGGYGASFSDVISDPGVLRSLVRSGNLDMIEAAINDGAIVIDDPYDSDDEDILQYGTFIQAAVQSGNLKIVELVINKQAQLVSNSRGNLPTQAIKSLEIMLKYSSDEEHIYNLLEEVITKGPSDTFPEATLSQFIRDSTLRILCSSSRYDFDWSRRTLLLLMACQASEEISTKLATLINQNSTFKETFISKASIAVLGAKNRDLSTLR